MDANYRLMVQSRKGIRGKLYRYGTIQDAKTNLINAEAAGYWDYWHLYKRDKLITQGKF